MRSPSSNGTLWRAIFLLVISVPTAALAGTAQYDGADSSFKSELNAQSLQDTQKTNTDYEAQINPLRTQIQDATHRIDLLQQEATKPTADFGCHLRDSLDMLEVQITGEYLEQDHYLKGTSTRNSQGVPDEFFFSFGDNLNYVLAAPDGSSAKNLPAGWQGNAAFFQKIDITDFASSKFPAIDRITITKKGVGYHTTSYEHVSANILGWKIGKKTYYESWETSRYHLTGIVIRFKGQIVYQRNGLDFTFEKEDSADANANLTKNAPKNAPKNTKDAKTAAAAAVKAAASVKQGLVWSDLNFKGTVEWANFLRDTNCTP